MATAKVFFPESDAVLQSFHAADDALYLQLLDGGKSRVERITYDGKKREVVPLPFDGAAGIYGERDRPGILFSLEGWTSRAKEFSYAPEHGVQDGFGTTTSQEREEWADLYAFALWQSGVTIGE